MRWGKIRIVKVIVNGETRELADGMNLRELLQHFELPTQRVAVELNKSVVRRAEWEKIEITDADRIEVVHFVGGG